jgi:hypothetical protein
VAADQAAILRMIQAAKAAAAAGRGSEADELLARAAQAVPEHPAVLNEQGLRMMQRGEAAIGAHAHTAAYRCHERTCDGARASDRASRLRLSRGQRDARVDPR